MSDLHPEQLEVVAEAGGGSIAGSVARDWVVSFASAVGRTLQTARLYDADHPLVRGAAEEACDWLMAEGGNEALTLGVGPGRLLDGEASFSEPAEVASLAEVLHGRDAGSVTFSASLDVGTLLAAVSVLREPAGLDAAGFCEALLAQTGGAVTGKAIDFGRVRTRESAAAKGKAWSWNDLVGDLILGSGGESSGDGDGGSDAGFESALCEAADWIAEQLGADSEAALHALHVTLHEAVGQAVRDMRGPDLTAGDAAALTSTDASGHGTSGVGRGDGPGGGAGYRGATRTLSRLNAFLVTLTPALRESLVGAADGLASGTAGGSGLHAEPEDLAAVLSAVSRMDGKVTKAAHESLMMCEKLAGLSESIREGFDASSEGATADDLGSGAAHGSGLVHSLEELLATHDPGEFTPDAYRTRLDQISRGSRGAAVLSREMREAFTAEALGRHALRLAVHLSTSGEDDPGPEPWLYLGRRLPVLIERGEVKEIAQITRNAEARLSRGGPEPTLDACRGVVEALRGALHQAGRLGEMLDRTDEPEDVATLLRYADLEMLREAVERVADASSDALAEPIARTLRNLDAASLHAAGDVLIAEDGGRRLPLVRRLGPMGFATATRWLGPLLTQKDAALRAEAFSVLAGSCPVWPADVAEGLLEHPDERVRSTSLTRLLGQRDPASLAVLGRVLVSRLSKGRGTPTALVDGMVGALLSAGEPGERVLREALGSMSGGWLHKRRHAAAALEAAIRGQGDEGVVRRLLNFKAGGSGEAA